MEFEPSIIESTIYEYTPTEPTILSPYVEFVDPKQKEISDLKQEVSELKDMLKQLLNASK